MQDGSTLGGRLASVRKRRGLTQKELARTSGVSLSLVRKVEQGDHDSVRLETARKLAVALKVPTTVLMTNSDRETPDPVTVDEWEPVRRALAGLDGQPDEQPTAEGVSAAVAAIRPAVAGNRFTAIRPALAALVRDASVLDRDDEASRQARFRALNMTAWVLTQVRQWETAMLTLDQAADAACGQQKDRQQHQRDERDLPTQDQHGADPCGARSCSTWRTPRYATTGRARHTTR